MANVRGPTVLEAIDRLQMAVPDADRVAALWQEILGAEPAGRDRVAALAARRLSLRLGRGWVELLEPDGAGPLADAVALRGAHMFAAGAATRDLPALLAHLRAQGCAPVEEGGQAFLDPAASGIAGLRLVLSPAQDLPPAGDIDFLYEATLLAPDHQGDTARFARLFGLVADSFVPITSDRFGYTGTLTLFDRDRLHRFEVIAPTDMTATMGRFLGRMGPVLYMAFAETARLSEIEQRIAARHPDRPGMTVDRPAGRAAGVIADQIWVHPPTLGGMMLGLSRPSMAWSWSGHPERVEEVRP